ncbi:hypothetical protein L798_01460 [Zootermopsis nevadensis]|uniref:Uncharacterized protein n=1 Tax=Zootermopsis nevadensis TaxID=136037 RepID=A0A067RRQ8_ZOONE|nr:hypothetical protein L798_01460 [Zootermopsis nevadensis]
MAQIIPSGHWDPAYHLSLLSVSASLGKFKRQPEAEAHQLSENYQKSSVIWSLHFKAGHSQQGVSISGIPPQRAGICSRPMEECDKALWPSGRQATFGTDCVSGMPEKAKMVPGAYENWGT